MNKKLINAIGAVMIAGFAAAASAASWGRGSRERAQGPGRVRRPGAASGTVTPTTVEQAQVTAG